MSISQSTSARISLGRKTLFGTGAACWIFTSQAPKQLANPVLVSVLGVSPALVGVILALPRLWDAITDPIMGNLSDRTRTRWGRRRPFIALGAILCFLTLNLLWLMPRGLSETFYATYYLAAMIGVYTAFTIFSVPFEALGYELTRGYHDRSRVQGVKAVIATVTGLLVSWVLALTQLPVFGDTLNGARIVTFGASLVLVLGAGLIPAFFIPEPPSPAIVQRTPLLPGLRTALTCRPFALLLGIKFLSGIGTTAVNGLGFYVINYHVYPDNLAATGVLTGAIATASHLLAIPMVGLFTRLSERIGKRPTLALCSLSVIVGSLSTFYTYSSAYPYLALLSAFLISPGIAAYEPILSSMVADTTDYHAETTGLRQEATFAALKLFTIKSMQSCSYLLAGIWVVWAGFEVTLGAQQTPATLLNLRLIYALFPAGLVAISLLLLWRYSLTEADIERIQAKAEL